jgi:hypothetical protein
MYGESNIYENNHTIENKNDNDNDYINNIGNKNWNDKFYINNNNKSSNNINKLCEINNYKENMHHNNKIIMNNRNICGNMYNDEILSNSQNINNLQINHKKSYNNRNINNSLNNKYNNKYIHTLLEIGCDEQSIDDWLAARKQRRAPEVNQSVINCLLREAGAANIPVSKAVEVAAEYGWQNFTAKWYLERVRPDEPKKKSGPRSVYERNLAEMRRGGLIDDNGNLV